MLVAAVGELVATAQVIERPKGGGVNPSIISSTFLKLTNRVKPSKSTELLVCPCNV